MTTGVRALIVLTGLTVLAVVAVLGAAVLDGDDEATRQEVVAELGATVMPFDLEATMHVFDTTDDGGVQEVVATDSSDAEQVRLIREHLSEEVDRFADGDFGDPASIHGHDMAGLEVLEANAADLEVTYEEIDAGAQVTYRSSSPVVVAALHEWFAAQLHDHGDHATTSG